MIYFSAFFPGRSPSCFSIAVVGSRVFTESGYRVYEVSDPMEPYTLVHKVVPVANKNSFRNRVAAGFDYQHVAAVEKSEEQTIPPSLRAS